MFTQDEFDPSNGIHHRQIDPFDPKLNLKPHQLWNELKHYLHQQTSTLTQDRSEIDSDAFSIDKKSESKI